MTTLLQLEIAQQHFRNTIHKAETLCLTHVQEQFYLLIENQNILIHNGDGIQIKNWPLLAAKVQQSFLGERVNFSAPSLDFLMKPYTNPTMESPAPAQLDFLDQHGPQHCLFKEINDD